MKHRILLPFLLQLVDEKSFKKFLLSLEIAFQGRYEQWLSKSSWTTQKVHIAILHQIINEASFIKIYISTLYDFFEVLYSYRIFHIAAFLKSFGKVTKNNDTSKGISRKNNEMQIPTYFYEGTIFWKAKRFLPFTLHQNTVYFCIIAIYTGEGYAPPFTHPSPPFTSTNFWAAQKRDS